MLAGERSHKVSRVYLKVSGVSFGSPVIKSIFICLKPISSASLYASKVCVAVCRLPIASRTSSFKVCGFMLILSQPPSRIASSFSRVIVSGLPASIVNSRHFFISKEAFIAVISFVSCSAEKVVGVPPPIYTVSSLRLSSLAISAVYFIS